MQHLSISDTIRIAFGGLISTILTVIEIDKLIGIIAGLATIIYMIVCIIHKRLQNKQLRQQIEREAKNDKRE